MSAKTKNPEKLKTLHLNWSTRFTERRRLRASGFPGDERDLHLVLGKRGFQLKRFFIFSHYGYL